MVVSAEAMAEDSVSALRHRSAASTHLNAGGPPQSAASTPAPVFVPVPRSRPRSGDGDFAAGPAHQFSLGAHGLLPLLCCWAPGLVLFSMMGVVIVSAAIAPDVFYIITAALTVFTLSYTANLAVSCVFGTYWMRRDSRRDWEAALRQLQEERPEAAEVMHIVILPNYQEEEHMLRHTLENIARSTLARGSIRIVLAMEEREGVAGRQKAERLIAETSHLFADVVAAYHPSGLPGEVAGKSSNTQWAYREMLRLYAMDLARLDASRVFLTVGDADTLWHPQFFSALAFQALQMPAHQRVWSIWQPPVLLLRNLFSVPAPTRLSCYGTLFFELAGLANQWFAPHFCYSAYSLTLALASHPLVGGWDRDVIAEDHHMFCKCYFAALWESVDSLSRGSTDVAIVPKVSLRPIFLPAMSFLVESDRGWLASCYARFQQARRHSQGIAELSYTLLQYITLVMSAGVRVPLLTHVRVLSIITKMATVHIINAVQSLAMIVTGALLVPGVVNWALSSGSEVLGQTNSVTEWMTLVAMQVSSRVGPRNLLAIFGPLPPVGLLLTAVAFTVVSDALTGKLTQAFSVDGAPGVDEQVAAPDVQGSAACSQGGRLNWRQKLGLIAQMQWDIVGTAEVTLVSYGLIPVAMAAWSLMRNGTKFEYIVAAKPT